MGIITFFINRSSRNLLQHSRLTHTHTRMVSNAVQCVLQEIRVETLLVLVNGSRRMDRARYLTYRYISQTNPPSARCGENKESVEIKRNLNISLKNKKEKEKMYNNNSCTNRNRGSSLIFLFYLTTFSRKHYWYLYRRVYIHWMRWANDGRPGWLGSRTRTDDMCFSIIHNNNNIVCKKKKSLS